MIRRALLSSAYRSEGPVDDLAREEAPPHDHRLKQQARAVIEPTYPAGAMLGVQQSVLYIGREDANRIKREHYSGGRAQAADRETECAGQLAQAGQEYRFARRRNPARRDAQKRARMCDMEIASQYEGRDQ